jgi:hypothetical protein
MLRTLLEDGSPQHLVLRLSGEARLVRLILWIDRGELLRRGKSLDHFALLCW